MRGHDQTDGRGWLRAWTWIALVVMAVPLRASAQDSTAPELASPSGESIDLAAERVLDWTVGAERWVILDGKAAVLQGVEGVRTDRAVVKILTEQAGDSARYRVEVYAEGHVHSTDRPNEPLRRLRAKFETNQGPVLKPYSSSGLVHCTGPPAGFATLLRSAFPPPAPVTAALPAAGPSATARISTPGSPRSIPAPLVRTEPAPPGPDPVAMAPLVAEVPVSRPADPAPAPLDPAVKRVQFPDEGFADIPALAQPAPETAPLEVPQPELQPPARTPSPATELAPFLEPPGPTLPAAPGGPSIPAPVVPGSQRIVSIFPRDAGPNFTFETLESTNGTTTLVVRGGVNLVTEDRPGTKEDDKRGTIDISADNAVIWRGPDPKGSKSVIGPNNEVIQDAKQPLEVYLEGNVVFRQDERKVAGNGDQKTYRAKRAYYDFRTERFVTLDGQLNMFSPGLIAPVTVTGPQIQQYRPTLVGPDGTLTYGRLRITAEHAMMTGSRFANPGYQFFSRSVDLNQVPSLLTDPVSGSIVGKPGDPNPPKDLSWLIDARQNFFYMGPVPVFYWPRIVTEPDDLDPPLRNLTPRFNNIFGQQLLSDWNGFKLFGISKPKYVQVDNWNVDIDYLSRRKSLALGSEFGYSGSDLLSDIANDFSPNNMSRNYKRQDLFPGIRGTYFGYLDFWGLEDHATDVLGSGPAVVTNGPPGAGKAGFQRISDPSFQDFRGRVMFRHMQSLNAPDDDPLDDFRLQVEAGLTTDRNFLEQYYKRLFDTGLDQATLLYMIRQQQNWAFTILTEANLQSWYTETQWLPKVDYYRLGDGLFGNLFTYYQDTGINWANTHTAVEVNNPNIFAFLPFDPVSNTSGPLRTGRVYTNQELDLPINLDVVRLVPYVQGQVVGWNNQLGGDMLGRVWGAAGVRASLMAWKRFPGVESELLNVHGLNHKITLDANYRDAFSNVSLNRIGVQDDLDENTYEFVRRYFALTNYAGGLLPLQYDPRFLILRRGISPITGTTDIQASIQMLQIGLHQRLQTKRGPEGRRRIIDYMVLDFTTTYFPDAARDNFGKSFGQNMYNYEWYIGDRTSIYSNGWFEFFDITGQALLKVNPRRHNDPFGSTVVNSGVVIARPPRGNLTVGYSIINTGTIATSAMNIMYSYWFSPKWYGAFGTSYDFGNAVALGSMFSLTRIGKDYLTSAGLTLNPLQKSVTFGFEIAPRLSPNLRLGSTSGMLRFDSRFAPTQ